MRPRPGSFILAALVAALLLASGCSGCRHAPIVRLIYEVDVASAYDGEKDPERIVTRARDVIAERLEALAGKRAGAVVVKGHDVVVEAGLDPAAVDLLKSLLARSGRLEFDLVDDAASDGLFGALKDEALPAGEGIALYEEMAPGGLDASGRKRSVKARYARMACRPASHAGESTSDCLERLRRWTSTLVVPADHRVAFQAVTEPVPGTEPPRFERVGWRTLVVLAQPELTNGAIAEAVAAQETKDLEDYYVAITFTPQGAARFEQITADNVNRRFAIDLDGVVDSAPVIRAKVSGGRASITMGAGDLDQQKRDARQLELVLRAGALPAPIRLVGEEAIQPAWR